MRTTRKPHGVAHGYRSGSETQIGQKLGRLGVPFLYEGFKFTWVQPEQPHRYTPDYLLPNGIIVECKGWFKTEDRQKHVLIREQHPFLDIRFVFDRSCQPIRKGAKTTYAEWCRGKNPKRFQWRFAEREVPRAWIAETPEAERVEAILDLCPGDPKLEDFLRCRL